MRCRVTGAWPWLVLALTTSGRLDAQTLDLAAQPLLGSSLSGGFLRDLPTSNTPFAIPEGIQSETIGDRFSGAGLNAATAPRFGAFLNSWTQTQFRVGDVSIVDPRTGGVPLFMPTLAMWERVTTTVAGMSLDENASGSSIVLEPRRPGDRWTRAFEGTFSAPFLVSEGGGLAPPVDQVRQWQDGSAFISGPVTGTVGLAAAASWRRLSHLAAPATVETADRVVSGLAHLVIAATPRDELRVLGWVQQIDAAAFADTSVHVQSTWQRRGADRLAWRAFGAYTARGRSVEAAPVQTVDSIVDDAVTDRLDTGAGSVSRWVAGARAASSAKLMPSFGIDVEGARMRADPVGVQQIGELVNGMPARLWTIRSPGTDDRRHSTTLAAFVNERLTPGPLTIDAGLRLDVASAAADLSESSIQWTTWLPRAMVRWQIIGTGGLAMTVGYRRSAYQLPLNVLAVGDAAAPVADVSLWTGQAASPIARVGPGTGGDAGFTAIDPKLERPTTDEGVLAFESRPVSWLQMEAAGIVKREQPLIGLTDSGVPSSAYSAFQVPDPSFEPGSPQGGPLVTVYNRPADAYGRDRYLLTNRTGDDPATFWGIDVNVRAATHRFTVLVGGTIWTRTMATAAAVGYLPTQNDQSVLGNLFVDPNAATAARGQVFPDRSHTVKAAVSGRLPWDVGVGAIARYQDGQPFARLVVVPNLTQGPTAVRAYVNGGTAFTYTGTLDVRVQKAFAVGRTQLTAALDVYNLPNLGNEVTENVVSGPAFRVPTSVQPPRTILLGVHVAF
jgi:hypothetical protein